MGRALAFVVILTAACGADEHLVDARESSDAVAGLDAADAADAAAPDAGVAPDAPSSPDASPPIDASPPPDARPDATPVMIDEVPCADATIAVVVTTSVTDYFPETMTIHVGDVIRFAPNDPHDVVAGTPAAPEPSWFAVAGNDPRCLRFDEAGAFPFFCTAHPSSMQGLVTVVP